MADAQLRTTTDCVIFFNFLTTFGSPLRKVVYFLKTPLVPTHVARTKPVISTNYYYYGQTMGISNWGLSEKLVILWLWPKMSKHAFICTEKCTWKGTQMK